MEGAVPARWCCVSELMGHFLALLRNSRKTGFQPGHGLQWAGKVCTDPLPGPLNGWPVAWTFETSWLLGVPSSVLMGLTTEGQLSPRQGHTTHPLGKSSACLRLQLVPILHHPPSLHLRFEDLKWPRNSHSPYCGVRVKYVTLWITLRLLRVS